MKISHYLRGIFARAKEGGTSAPRMGLRNTAVIVGGDPMKVATVYRCINLLADSVANLPMLYMRLRGGVFAEDTTSRLHYLLNVQPCPYLSAPDFWRHVIRCVHLCGNAYIVPIYNEITFEIEQLVPVNPTYVTHNTTNDTYTITDTMAGISGTYAEGDIIHIKNYSVDGKQGISTLTFARNATDIALTGDNETLSRLANGGSVRGLLSNDTSVRGFGEYQDEQLQNAAIDLDGRFRSGERIVSIPGQAQFTPIALSSADMQFLETRKFSVRDICRFFGVHPSFVFDDTSNNYKSAEMANVAFLSNTLNPLLRTIEVEMHRKLVAPSLCCKRRFQFDRRALYACDLESRIRYQAQTIAAGIYTINDWRKEENRLPVEGGDKVLVSANLKDINEKPQPPQDVEE